MVELGIGVSEPGHCSFGYSGVHICEECKAMSSIDFLFHQLRFSKLFKIHAALCLKVVDNNLMGNNVCYV